MAWGSHALAHHPFSLFDANLFYPLDHTLAFSDHLLGVLPVFAPVYAATGNPVAAANTVFLLSFALSAFAAFCLTYVLTSAPWPSFLACSPSDSQSVAWEPSEASPLPRRAR